MNIKEHKDHYEQLYANMLDYKKEAIFQETENCKITHKEIENNNEK